MNTIIYPKPRSNFRVFKRKIQLFYKSDNELLYLCSSMAYKRCRDFVEAFRELNPHVEFRAFFTKD